MLQIHDGQCGMCTHFGENQPEEQPKLIQIRLEHGAPDDLVEACGHPSNKPLSLMVTPISGCAGFESVHQA